MAKTMKLTYKNEDYVLEFTRKTVKQMGDAGFRTDDLSNNPASALPALFAGAFLANHRSVKQTLVDEMFDRIPNKEEFFVKLSEMYSEPLETLMSEPESDEGNAKWEADF